DEFEWEAVDKTSSSTKMSKDGDSSFYDNRCDQAVSRIQVYKQKKAESEKGKFDKVPKKPHVSPVRSGRGKGYMRLGDQEVNVPSAFKKNVVPKKTRSLTVTDNIVEETVAVELAKSLSIKEQQCQQYAIMTQLTIDRQIEIDVEDTGSKESSLRQENQPVGGEGSSATHDKYYEFEEISATDSDATQDSSCSETDDEKDDETDDSDNSDMDLSNDEPKEDDNAAGFGVFMYNKSIKPLESTYLSPTVTCSSLEYIQSLLNEPYANELTDFMSNLVYIDTHTTSKVANLNGNHEEMFPDEAAHHT
ncbi:hypothetical protein Tco_0659931, partial [Tanacetum coccineum]